MALIGDGIQAGLNVYDPSPYLAAQSRATQSIGNSLSAGIGAASDAIDKRREYKDMVKASTTKLKAARDLFGDEGGYLDKLLLEIEDEEKPLSTRATIAGTANEMLALGIDKMNTDRQFAIQDRGLQLEERRITEGSRQFDTGIQADAYQAQTKQTFDNQTSLDEGINKMIAAQELATQYGDKIPALPGLQERFQQAVEAGDGFGAKSVAAEYDAIIKPQVESLMKGQGFKLSTIGTTLPDGRPGEMNVFVDPTGGVYDIKGSKLNPEAFLPEPGGEGMVLPPRDDVPQGSRVPAMPKTVIGSRPMGTPTAKTATEQALDDLKLTKAQEDAKTQAASVAGGKAKISQAIDSLKAIRNHPGRWAATGKTSYFPTVRGTDAYDFEQKLEQAKALAGTIGIEAMRGLGAMSEKEFEAAKASIAQLTIGMKTESVEKELDKLIGLFESKMGAKASAQPGLTPADDEDDATNQLRAFGQ